MPIFGYILTTTALMTVFVFFSAAEEIEVAETPTIILATSDWEPYYAEKLASGGVVTEIVRTAFQRMGYKLEVKWLPWARAINTAKAGYYDGVLGAWYTEDREQFFNYSKPFLKNDIVFFKLKGEPITYTSLLDLKSYRVGVTRNSGPHELLKSELNESLDIVVIADLNIKKLMAKRIDLFVDERLGVQYIINTQFPEWRGSIEALEPPLQVNDLHIMISKRVNNNQKIINDFNEGLQLILHDGTLENLLKENGFNK